MEVLLVIPPAAEIQTRREVPPLGLLYLAASLKKESFDVEVWDMLGQNVRREDVKWFIEEYKPKMIGFSVVVSTYNTALKIARYIKSLWPELPIIFGGPHASLLPEETLATGVVDIVGMYEGEATIVELAYHYCRGDGSLDKIKGIAYSRNEQVIFTENREVADVNSLPMPARDYVNLARYDFPGTIVAARGCPNNCVFCAIGVLARGQYRCRNISDVCDEIEGMRSAYGVTNISFVDDTFSLAVDRVNSLCEEIFKRGMKFNWSCGSRVYDIDTQLLKDMKKAGCTKISVGMECGSNRVLTDINKGITVEDSLEFANKVLSNGINLTGYFVIGLPTDTYETAFQTIQFSKEIKALTQKYPGCEVLTTYTLCTPLPGTPLYINADSLGIKFITKNWDLYNFVDPVMETDYLNEKQLRELFTTAVGKSFGY